MFRKLRALLARVLAPALPPGGRGGRDDGERGGDDGEAAPPDGDGVVLMPIEDALDLHTFAPRDVPSVVEEYLYEAQRLGFAEVRIIHGRGKGVQRRVVQALLPRHPAVEGFRDAPASRGGWGATIVWLKRPGEASDTRR